MAITISGQVALVGQISVAITPEPIILLDDFNRADTSGGVFGTASGGFIWQRLEDTGGPHIVSNEAYKPGTGVNNYFYRAEQDVSSENHYAQITLLGHTNSSSSVSSGVTVRNADGSDAVCYSGEILSTGGSTLTYRILRNNITLGQRVVLATTSVTASFPKTVKIEVNGSQLSLYVDDVLQLGPISNTDITGNTKTGMVWVGGGGMAMDNFEAGDL